MTHKQNKSFAMVQATNKDLEIVYALIVDASRWLHEKYIPQWNPPYPKHRVAEEIKNGEVFIFSDTQNVIGTVTLLANKPRYYPSSFWEDTANAWYICRLTINRSFANRGIGKQILHAVENMAKDFGVRNLRLDVVKANHFLENYYKKRGFTTIFEAESHGAPSIFMEKKFTANQV